MKRTLKISNDVVFFVHIPKCAGTSLGSFFSKRLRPVEGFFWHGHDGDVNNLANEFDLSQNSSDSDENSIRFIGGHYTLSATRAIIQDAALLNPLICSVIRNPIEQAESYYNWITSESVTKGAKHPLYDHSKDMTPLEFFHDQRILDEVANIQCKYLLGVNCESTGSHDIKGLALDLLLQDRLYIADVSKSDSLITAVSDLVFGYQNEEQRTIQAPRENVSSIKKHKFDENSKHLIKNVFWGDLLLYETLKKSQNNAVEHIFL